MATKTSSKPGKLLKINTSSFWDKHVDRVRQAIKELDRKHIQSMADAISIVVTNETHPLKKGR